MSCFNGNKTNQNRITILSLIFLVLMVDGALIYTPKEYHYVLNHNVRRIVPLRALCTISSFDSHYLHHSVVSLAGYFTI